MYDEQIQTSPYSNNPVFKKRKFPSIYGLVHKRRPFSNVPENSEWFDNSEDGGENNEVFFCFIYFITIVWQSLFSEVLRAYNLLPFFGRYIKDLEDCQF